MRKRFIIGGITFLVAGIAGLTIVANSNYENMPELEICLAWGALIIVIFGFVLLICSVFIKHKKEDKL